MEKVCGIYMIKNKVNGKMYIGQSRNIRRRWLQHKTVYYNKNSKAYNLPINSAIRKYGLKEFEFTILKECPINLLDLYEVEYIKKYQTLINQNGYNISIGGNNSNHFRTLNDIQLKNLINDLLGCEYTKVELGEKYSMSRASIDYINRGEIYYDDNLSYPIRKIFDTEIHSMRVKSKDKRYLIDNKCVLCGGDVYSVQKSSKYCSKECKFKYENNIEYTGLCKCCGKNILNKSNRVYCSKECQAKDDLKVDLDKNKLEYLLEIMPSYTDIAKHLGGVSSTTIKKRVLKFNIRGINYWVSRYEKEHGYTYKQYKQYLEFKNNNADLFNYIIFNYEKISRKKLVYVDKLVSRTVYDVIGIKHGLKSPKIINQYK